MIANPFRRGRAVAHPDEHLSLQGWHLACAEESAAREAARKSRRWLGRVALGIGFLLLLSRCAPRLHAEGLAEIQRRAIHREIVTVEEHNRIVTEWQRAPGRTTMFSGATASMEPAVSWWDMVLLEEVKPGEKLKTGEIYVYDGDAKWIAALQAEMLPPLHIAGVLHQLVRISGEDLLFRGLNNRRYDPWTKRSTVKYVVRRVLGTRRDTFAGGMNP